jgi:hypothetical protein
MPTGRLSAALSCMMRPKLVLRPIVHQAACRLKPECRLGGLQTMHFAHRIPPAPSGRNPKNPTPTQCRPPLTA